MTGKYWVVSFGGVNDLDFFCRRQNKNPIPMTASNATTTPTTIPAIAPPPRPEEEVDELLVLTGEEFEFWAAIVDDDADVVEAIEEIAGAEEIAGVVDVAAAIDEE